MSEFEEDEKRQVFGFDLRCTDSEAREILARVRATAEWHRWGVLDYQVRFGAFEATSREGRELCERLADADCACSKVVLRIITDVLHHSEER